MTETKKNTETFCFRSEFKVVVKKREHFVSNLCRFFSYISCNFFRIPYKTPKYPIITNVDGDPNTLDEGIP